MDTSFLTPEKVPELWFTDADVVFKAGTKLFRVHRGILSARSTVFNDMFSLPHTNGERIVNSDDSYINIHLPDDSTDVHHFFLAIFDASYFEPHPSEQPIPVVISVLRLAHKYDVVFLKRRAIAHLNAILPTKWDDTWRLVNSEEFYEQPERRLDVLPLLDLGAVFETPWLLPALHFTLAPVRINYIFERTAWKSLDRSTQEKFIITRESFFSRQGSSLGRVWTFAPSCLSEQLCMSGLCQIREFGLWKLYLKRDVPILCCEKCTKSFLNECFTSGKTFWENLPQIVCLGSWKNLNDAKDLYAV